MTDRHPDRQTGWNDNKAHSLRCERDATDRQTDRDQTEACPLSAVDWGSVTAARRLA